MFVRKRKMAVPFLCLALVVAAAGVPSHARDRDPRPLLVFSNFPCDGMGRLFSRILVEAYGRLGSDVSIWRVPAQRGLVMANQGQCDGVAARAAAIEEECPNLLRVPTPLYVNTVVAFSKLRGVNPEKGWPALAPYRLGSVLGYKYVEKHASRFGNHVLVSCYSQLFAMLKNDRVDVAVAEYLDVLPSLRGFDFGEIRALSPPLAQVPMYHYLHRKHAEMVPAVDRALRDMCREGRLEALLEEIRAGVDGLEPMPCATSQAP